METIFENLVKDAPIAAALLIMAWMHQRRDVQRDAMVERTVDRQIEADAATQKALSDLTTEISALRAIMSTIAEGIRGP